MTMATTPRQRKGGRFTQTIVAEGSMLVSRYLKDHGYDRDPGRYNVWVDRRRVGPDGWIDAGDLVTIGPRGVKKPRSAAPIKPRLRRPARKVRGLGELVGGWIEGGDPVEQREALEQFKRSINETRARSGGRILYP